MEMDKRKALILFIFLHFFFSPAAMSADDDMFSENGQQESVEDLSLKIKSALPNISYKYAAQLAETVYLIRKLKREIYLTRKIAELREENKSWEEAAFAAEEEISAEEKSAVEEEIVSDTGGPKISEYAEKSEEGIPPEEAAATAKTEEIEENYSGKKDKEKPAQAKEKSGSEKVIAPTVPPAPMFQVYTKNELAPGMTSVIIEKGQSVLIPAAGLSRFMVTDPRLLEAKRAGEKVSITGLELGRTFVHIWDAKGLRTIKVTITQPGYKKYAEARKIAAEAAKMESFKARYSYDQYRFDSSSDTPSRKYMYEEYFHRLNITGQTPWGMTGSRIQYEGRAPSGNAEEESDLTAWDFNLRGEDVEVYLGNVGANFSDLTLPSTSYQGFRFKNPDSEKVNYDIVGGARGNRMWGYRVLGWDKANYFYGARAQVEPADFINFNTTAMRAKEYDDQAGEWVVSSGMGLNFFEDIINIKAEAARNKTMATERDNHAFQIDSIMKLKDYGFRLRGIYRDIDPDFRLVTGMTAPNVGKLGYSLNADYNPFDYIRVTGEYDVFRNRQSFNPLETLRYNYDWRGTVDFNVDPLKFKYAIYDRLHEGEATPSRGFGEMYQVAYNTALPKPLQSVDLSLRYEPSKYKNLFDNTPSYIERKYGAGMRLNVIKNLYYDLQESWHYRKMTESAEHGVVNTLSTGVFYSTQILDTPFYGSMGIRYKREYGVMDNISLTSGENIVGGEGEIKFRPSGDYETYIRANYQHIRGVIDHSKSRQEARIYGGGSYYFDTTLRWGLGGSIKGCVFEDLNGNGEKDVGEKGFPGVDVYVGEDYATITDINGEFEFRSVKGYDVSVLYDPKMVPEGYKATTPNPQTATLKHGVASEVNFGTLAVAEISGIVFHDVNLNGELDVEDEGVMNVRINLDDGTAALTMASGHYRLEDVRPKTFALTLDATTLPNNLVPLTKIKRTIEAKGGKYYEENFPVYALRTIIGTVFVDENNNGRFDSGEKGVADVVLRCADSASLTDLDGRYFLKKLPAGKRDMAVDIESIPKEYELAVSPLRTVELLIEGEIKENVNFPLKDKQ